MVEKIFPHAPVSLKWSIIILILVVSTLYLDSVQELQTNPIIFFISVVIFPITLATLNSRIEGHRLDEQLSFRGDFTFALSMLLISAGLISLLFFFVTRPLALAYRGTSLYKGFTVLYMPLSTKTLWFTTLPAVFGLLYYTVIAVGEEVLKVFFWKNISNWLYSKFDLPKTLIILVALLFAFLAWLSCHFISWNGLPIVGIVMGIVYSIIFMIPYYFGEPLISPEKGIQLNKFSIYAPIGGHLCYDFLLFLFTEGYLASISSGFGLFVSTGLLGIGGFLLVTKYLEMGYFQKGVIITRPL
ncbi:MAG: hypothetical protein ACTSW1_00715 [Candidatus Hodarchaeales archaeon]